MYQRNYNSQRKTYFSKIYNGTINDFYKMIQERESEINNIIKLILIDRCSANLESMGVANSHSSDMLRNIMCLTDSRKFVQDPITGIKETVEYEINLQLNGFMNINLVPKNDEKTIFEIYGNKNDMSKILNALDEPESSVIENYESSLLGRTISLSLWTPMEIAKILSDISVKDILENMASPEESVEYFYNKYSNLQRKGTTLVNYRNLLNSLG